MLKTFTHRRQASLLLCCSMLLLDSHRAVSCIELLRSKKFHITTPPIPRMLKVLKFAFSTKFWAFQTYPQTRPPSSPWWTTIRGCSPPSSCMPWPSSLSGFLWFRISSLVQDQQIQVEDRNDRLSDLRRAGRRLLQ